MRTALEVAAHRGAHLGQSKLGGALGGSADKRIDPVRHRVEHVEFRQRHRDRDVHAYRRAIHRKTTPMALIQIAKHLAISAGSQRRGRDAHQVQRASAAGGQFPDEGVAAALFGRAAGPAQMTHAIAGKNVGQGHHLLVGRDVIGQQAPIGHAVFPQLVDREAKRARLHRLAQQRRKLLQLAAGDLLPLQRRFGSEHVDAQRRVWQQRGDVDAQPLAVEAVEVLGESLPIPAQAPAPSPPSGSLRCGS